MFYASKYRYDITICSAIACVTVQCVWCKGLGPLIFYLKYFAHQLKEPYSVSRAPKFDNPKAYLKHPSPYLYYNEVGGQFKSMELRSLGHGACINPHGPLTRYVKLWVAHAPGMPGTFSPPPLVSDPGMHPGTCVTHVPRCMSGSLTCGGVENVPGILGACATRNFTYLAKGPLLDISGMWVPIKNYGAGILGICLIYI